VSAVNGVLSGGPSDTFIGGSGQSTMTGGGGINLYEFNSSSPGGTAVINNFVQNSDQLQLNGYNIATVLASDITQSGGNTYINLGGGTTIELKNFTGTLHTGDFKP
jgi:Ca2+-binding RTX toxin-like protein